MARIRNKRQQERKRFYEARRAASEAHKLEALERRDSYKLRYGSVIPSDRFGEGFRTHGLGFATSGVFQDCTTQGHNERKLQDEKYRRTPSKARSIGKLVKYNITEIANA